MYRVWRSGTNVRKMIKITTTIFKWTLWLHTESLKPSQFYIYTCTMRTALRIHLIFMLVFVGMLLPVVLAGAELSSSQGDPDLMVASIFRHRAKLGSARCQASDEIEIVISYQSRWSSTRLPPFPRIYALKSASLLSGLCPCCLEITSHSRDQGFASRTRFFC